MASTLSSTQAEPLFDDRAVPKVQGAVPTVPTASSEGVEESLARLARQAASDTPDARHRAPTFDRAADARISQSSAATTLGPATLGPATLGPATLGPADPSAQIPREPPSSGKRRTFARVAIMVCLGASAIWAWRSYGGPAGEIIAALVPRPGMTSARPAAEQPFVPRTLDGAPDPAPAQAAAPPAAAPPAVAPPAVASALPAQAASIAPPTPAPPAASAPTAAAADHNQINAMARDVAALRQTVEQLAAGQEQLKGEIARLQAEKSAADKRPPERPKKRVVRHVLPADHPSDAFNPAQHPHAPGAPHTLGSVVVRRAAPPPDSPVSASSLPPPPPPDMRRPPAPVPQP